jgi:hypothetical protein
LWGRLQRAVPLGSAELCVSPRNRRSSALERKSAPVVGRLVGLLDFDPSAVTPVTVAFVLAPPGLLALSPFPVVWMDGELEIGMKVVPFDVPTVALDVTRDFC